MKIGNIELFGLSIIIGKNLIIADIHIGQEESLNNDGVLLPRFFFKDQIEMLSKILITKDIDTVIINGDLKHEHGRISESEWKNTLKFLDLLENRKIILIKGNHDKILNPIIQKRKLEMKDYLVIDNNLICHGDKILETTEKYNTIIIGHEHPAISIREGMRVETYKCYIIGKYKSKKLIVQPSFNLISSGTDVTKEQLLSPYLNDIFNMEAYIVDQKIYHFGKIKGLINGKN
jgi:uncharacterized protein